MGGCGQKNVEKDQPEPLTEYQIEREARRIYEVIKYDVSRWYRAMDQGNESDKDFYLNEMIHKLADERISARLRFGAPFTDEDWDTIDDKVTEWGEADNPL